MTKIQLALLTLTVLATEVSAQSRTFYNSSGQSIGRATTSGNTTTFRDSSGRPTSRAVTNGNTTHELRYRRAGHQPRDDDGQHHHDVPR